MPPHSKGKNWKQHLYTSVSSERPDERNVWNGERKTKETWWHLIYTHTHQIKQVSITSWFRVKSHASIQTLVVRQYKSANSVCMPCVHWVNEKCLKLGVGRRIRATIRCFCRGTSILAHLNILGYGPGRHKQPKRTHILSGSECVGAPLRTTHWWSPKGISRVTPLFSRLPSFQTTSARARD